MFDSQDIIQQGMVWAIYDAWEKGNNHGMEILEWVRMTASCNET